MIQWIAATLAGRSTAYYTFKDKKADGLDAVVNSMQARGEHQILFSVTCALLLVNLNMVARRLEPSLCSVVSALCGF